MRRPIEFTRTMLRLAAGVAVALMATSFAGAAEPADEGMIAQGREIFQREWLPNDPRSHGGDGLGPVFNDTSCVACHNQGGPGGGGPVGKNANIATAVFNGHVGMHQAQPAMPGVGSQIFRVLIGLDPNPNPQPKQEDQEERIAKRAEALRKSLLEEVVRIHPGFSTAGSVVVHHDSTEKGYADWKSRFVNQNQFFGQQFANQAAGFAVDMPVPAANIKQTREAREAMMRAQQQLARLRSQVNAAQFQSITGHGQFALTMTQRNPTALFGVGLMDAVSDEDLEAAAKVKHKDFPEVTGRVARLADGKLGRFGWKAQKATLREFTVTACAVELGLHVPEHAQSGNPLDAKYTPTGYDLTKDECTALVEYLRDLPAPKQLAPDTPRVKEYLHEGEELFSTVGCAACHTPELGNAEGIYSDLLLHDMGQDLGDTGSYGVFVPNSPGSDESSPVPTLAELKERMKHGNFQQAAMFGGLKHPTPEEEKKIVGALQREWRTPPLWGVRDSAPYLHDGRAKTLEHAIALHGGEASRSAQKFFALGPVEQRQVLTFLRSLTAPSVVAAAK